MYLVEIELSCGKLKISLLIRAETHQELIKKAQDEIEERVNREWVEVRFPVRQVWVFATKWRSTQSFRVRQPKTREGLIKELKKGIERTL